MLKVGVIGNYGHNNNGDEAILTGIIEQLTNHLNVKEEDIVVFSNNVQNTQQRYGLKSCPLMQKKKSLFGTAIATIAAQYKVFKQLDVVIIGGGGLLMDMYKRDAPLYSTLGRIAKFCGCKVVVYGVGAGPIKTTLGKFFIKNLVNNADSVSVRDKKSQQLLGEIGIKKDVKVIGDPAFFVPTSKSSTSSEKVKNIGVTAVPYYSKEYWPETNLEKYHSYIEGMARNLDILIKELHIQVTFYSTKYPEDVQVTKDIYEKMKCKDGVNVLEENLSPTEIVAISEQQDIIIGTRLHSLILGLVAQTPILGIGYHEKVEDFMVAINSHNTYIDIHNLHKDDELFIRRIREMGASWLESRNKYAVTSNRYKEESAKGIKQLAEVIKK